MPPSIPINWRSWASASALLLMAGCGTTPAVGTDVLTPGMPNPEIALRDGVREVDAEMTHLGTMNGYGPQRLAEPVLPGELQQTVTVAFSGLLDDGVRNLAHTVGYTLVITPPPPPPSGTTAAPLTVSVSTGFVTAAEAFRVMGDAAGSRALVRVDPLRHRVEVVHYA